MKAMRRLVLGGVLVGVIAVAVVLGRAIHARHMDHWLPAYVKQALRTSQPQVQGPVHIMIFFTDHFEPKFNWPGTAPPEGDPARERRRVARWTTEYPILADKHRDAYGRPPQHTFFYPYDEFEAWTLQEVNRLVYAGYGEVELHLHHHGDTADSLRAKLEEAKLAFAKYGAFVTFEEQPQHTYGFIHGAWALDNSEPSRDLCGVNTELDVLRETGCYADFTFPAVHQAAQPRTINSIYYAIDTPQPKSYDTGIRAQVGNPPPEGGLLLIEGILGLRGKRGPWNLIPGVETSGVFYRNNPPTPERAAYWIRTGVHVKGRPEWIFVKLHCHGADESQMESFFDGAFDKCFSFLESKYNDGQRYVLHYVTAREAYNIVKAAEAGERGDPDQYRDYTIAPPANRFLLASAPYRLHSGGATVDAEILDTGPVTIQFRTGPIVKLIGQVSRVTLAEGDAVLLPAPGESPVRLWTRRPITAVEGGAFTTETDSDGTPVYRVTPQASEVKVHFGQGAESV